MSIRIGPAIMAVGMSMSIASIITTHAQAAPVVPASHVHANAKLAPITAMTELDKPSARGPGAPGSPHGVQPAGRLST